MNLGKVIGTVVATRKDESLVGLKLLITQPLDAKWKACGNEKIMVDTVGAGVGELVLYVTGAAARNAAARKDAALDAAVVGIVDEVEISDNWLVERESGEEGERELE